MLTIGIEEEFFVVDPKRHTLAADGLPGFDRLKKSSAVGDDGVSGFDDEFQLSIVESRTGICKSLDQVQIELKLLRNALVNTAGESGLSIVSAGTLPTSDWRTFRITNKPRYWHIAEHYREVVNRRATCGCHIHIGIADRDIAVQVLNRVQPWLPVLLALSTSSPFYDGADTGYSSFRSTLWGSFPVAGSPGVFNSYDEYSAQVQLLVKTGAIVDEGNIFWDARLGTRFETLEFRIADACTTLDETVLLAALCRGLTLTCLREIADSKSATDFRAELLKAATWRAARHGLDDTLIDVVAAEKVPAALIIDRFLHYIRAALEELGDWDTVVDLVEQMQRCGTSTQRQHRLFAESGNIEYVVDQLIAETSGMPCASVFTSTGVAYGS